MIDLGQGHLLILAGEIAWPIKVKVCGAFMGRGELKFDREIGVTLPRWPPRSYMVKPLKNLLLINRQADFHETLYVAFGTPAHHSLIN